MSITRMPTREVNTIVATQAGVFGTNGYNTTSTRTVVETRELEFQKIKLRTSIYVKFAIGKP